MEKKYQDDVEIKDMKWLLEKALNEKKNENN